LNRRPIIKHREKETSDGVRRKETEVNYKSDNNKIHKGEIIQTTTITEKTPFKSIEAVFGDKMGASTDDLLMSMKNDAVDVLNKAGISIDDVKTEYNLEGKNHIKYETVQARTEEHTDEWHAARVLLHVRQTNIKKKRDVESAVWNAIKATHHHMKFSIDRYAYTIGLERTRNTQGREYIRVAEKIRKEDNITIKELLNKKRKGSRTINWLTTQVLDYMSKNNMPDKDESTVRKVLMAYYGKP